MIDRQWRVCVGVQENVCTHTSGPADDLTLQLIDSAAEGEEDAMDVPFLQVEGGGHGAKAEASGEQSERQEHRVGQRQARSPRQTPLTLTPLQLL